MEDTPTYVGDISIRYPYRAEDRAESLQVNYSLLAQSEIDALRYEVEKLRRSLAEAKEAFRELWQFADTYMPEISEDQAERWHKVGWENNK